LVGKFVGIQESLDIIQRWMFIHCKTKEKVNLIALPREFLLFKFSYEENLEKVMEFGPWL